MNRKLVIVFAFAMVLAVHNTSEAQNRTALLEMGDSITRHSRVLNEERTLWIALPRGYAVSSDRFPVVFVLDGTLNLMHTAGTALFLSAYECMPQVIVVGLVGGDRKCDYTPSESQNSQRYPNAGGGKKFLEYLEKEVIPYVERRYRTTSQRMVIGHSLGGLLVLQGLMEKPDLFTRYLAISPSLWWNEWEMVPRIEQFIASKSRLEKQVFIAMADEETEGEGRVAAMNRRIADKCPEGFRFNFQCFPEENHASIAIRSTLAGFQWFFEK